MAAKFHFKIIKLQKRKVMEWKMKLIETVRMIYPITKGQPSCTIQKPLGLKKVLWTFMGNALCTSCNTIYYIYKLEDISIVCKPIMNIFWYLSQDRSRARTPQNRVPSSKSSHDQIDRPVSNRNSIQRSVTPVRFRPEPSFSFGSSNLKPSGGIEFNESE